ncbi:MarR family winged helix-turn-helix transcriptional regulator (plasmid) [Nitrobacteraceae bacterium UC4446_H13]
MKSSRKAWRVINIGRRLNEAVRVFESRILALLRMKGHDQLTLSHINLTRNLDEGGTRLTELARRAAMTKQSMGEMVDQVVRTGLIKKMPDPSDGRAKLVCFTKAGFVWLEAFRQSLEQAEREMRDELGDEAVSSIIDMLGRYIAVADMEDKVRDSG